MRNRSFVSVARTGPLCLAVVLNILPEPAAAQKSATTTAGATAPATDRAEAGGVADIIVTAQRREERLQDVPISVTAIGGEELQARGVTGTQTISQIVPSVQLTQSGPSAIFFVRGVGNLSGNVGEEGANAFYVDGVYLGDLNSAAVKFNNIQRVEVLKGPQGTLFGRNSSGGLINIITREPRDETVVAGFVGYGNYDTLEGQLYAATPLGEKVSADLALTAKDQRNGFGQNFATGKDVQKGHYFGVRSKLVFRPDDATKLTLAGDYYHDRNDYQNGFNLFEGSVGIDRSVYQGDYNLRTVEPAYANIRTGGVALTGEHDFDWATLTSITARRWVKVRSAFDADYTPTRLVSVFVRSRVRTFQQELRLASPTAGPFNWQVGLFYYNAAANVDDFSLRGPAFGGLNNGTTVVARMKTDSYAAFGEASYDLAAATHLTVGLRYTKDERDYRGQTTAVPSGVVTRPADQSLSSGRLTYRLALRQDLSEDVNIYASYNRGFKSGIFALTGTPGDPPVKPQTIDAFEVGLKSQLFDNLLRFNVAGFHYKIDDYQVRASPAPGRTLLLNAASVKVDGVEAELTIAPSRGLQINLIGTYLDSRFSDFPGSLFSYPRPAVCNATGANPPGMSTGAPTGGDLNCVGNARGNRTPLSPKVATSASFSYRIPFGQRQALILNGLWNHSSTIFFESDNRLRQKAYDVLNASVEFRPAPSWGVELYANNFGDEQYYYTGVSGTTGDHGELAAPRTYGIRLKFDL